MDAKTPRATLRSAAKRFMQQSAAQAALILAPLVAVALNPAARAQSVVFTAMPESSFNGAPIYNGTSGLSFADGDTSYDGFFSAQLPQLGDIVGAKQGLNASFTFTQASSGGDAYVYFGDTTFTGTIPSSTNIPVAYSFDLATTGTVSINWLEVVFTFYDNSINDYNDAALQSSGTGNFTGSFSGYSAGFDFDGSNGGHGVLFLHIGYDSASDGDTISLTMDPATQGIGFNSTALSSPIPEPAAYATLAGLAAFGLVLHRRRATAPTAA